MDKNIPEITLYFKMGVVGLADEVNETLTLSFDPSLPDEVSMQLFAAKAQAVQARMEVGMTRLMLSLAEHIEKIVDSQEE